jgi:hypothetical protein
MVALPIGLGVGQRHELHPLAGIPVAAAGEPTQAGLGIRKGIILRSEVQLFVWAEVV